MEKSRRFLILSVISIFLLLLLSQTLSPKNQEIASLTKDHINSKVAITARVLNQRIIDPDFQILTLQDKTGNITAILDSNLKVNLNKSKEYIFIGRVQEYEKQIQINILKIRE